MFKALTTLAAASLVAASASAVPIQIDIVGRVDYNSITFGAFGGMAPGTPATTSFQVDSDNFLNGFHPTRGYVIDQASFVMTVGSSVVNMANPYPAGETPYFVLRNNDPGVDGFLLASHPDVSQPDGVWTDEPALIHPTFHAVFHATYGGSTLPSLNILDALGTYTFAGLTVFHWGANDSSFEPMGLIFDHFTISVVPAPGAAAFLLLAPLAMRRRRAS